MKTNLITLLILDLPQLQFSQSNLSLLFLLSKSITFSDSFVCRVKWHWHMHLIRSFYLPETNAGSYQVLSIYGRLDTKLHLIQHPLLLWLGACQSWEVHISYACWRQTHTRLPPLLRVISLCKEWFHMQGFHFELLIKLKYFTWTQIIWVNTLFSAKSSLTLD